MGIESIERSHRAPRGIHAIRGFDVGEYEALSRLGINISERRTREMIRGMDAAGFAMDNLTPTVTTGSIPTPVQFLETWLPGFVEILTAPRKIDDLVGVSTIGNWYDAKIVQAIMELTGTSVPYGDYINIPLSSWNVNFDERSVVRFTEGMQVFKLESERAAAMRVDSAAAKRRAAALALEIVRNKIGFFGYNAGNNATYGFLNDPGLPAYISAPNGASGSSHWATKTLLEIIADILTMVATLRTQSQDAIDPETTNITLALATDVVDYLGTVSDFGFSVRAWLKDTYPRIRIVSAPELNNANGGANVGYMFAEQFTDDSTDDGRVFMQVVPAKFNVLGVEQKINGYQEAYTNATAGVICKRPFAVVRISGI